MAFEILEDRADKTNALGQPVANWDTKFTVEGYLDLLSGDEGKSSNSLIAEASLVFITFDVKPITNLHRIKDTKTDAVYEITYVDNPMGLDEHLEIYCKKVA